MPMCQTKRGSPFATKPDEKKPESAEVAGQRSLVENDGGLFNAPNSPSDDVILSHPNVKQPPELEGLKPGETAAMRLKDGTTIAATSRADGSVETSIIPGDEYDDDKRYDIVDVGKR